jgi:hypothetical protein
MIQKREKVTFLASHTIDLKLRSCDYTSIVVIISGFMLGDFPCLVESRGVELVREQNDRA